MESGGHYWPCSLVAKRLECHMGVCIEPPLITKLDAKSIAMALVFKAASNMLSLSSSGNMGYHSNGHGHYLCSSEG